MKLEEFELLEVGEYDGLDYQIYERLCSECDYPLCLCDCSMPEQIELFGDDNERRSEKD